MERKPARCAAVIPSIQRSISRSPGATRARTRSLSTFTPVPGHRVDAGVAQRRERAVESETAAVGEVPDVLRAVGVQVHAAASRP